MTPLCLWPGARSAPRSILGRDAPESTTHVAQKPQHTVVPDVARASPKHINRPGARSAPRSILGRDAPESTKHVSQRPQHTVVADVARTTSRFVLVVQTFGFFDAPLQAARVNGRPRETARAQELKRENEPKCNTTPRTSDTKQNIPSPCSFERSVPALSQQKINLWGRNSGLTLTGSPR